MLEIDKEGVQVPDTLTPLKSEITVKTDNSAVAVKRDATMDPMTQGGGEGS